VSYIQLANPDFSIAGQIGYCLQYAREVFHCPAVEPNAWTAWLNAEFKHADRNLPGDVIAPMWYSYIENGENLGHVTINVPGKGIFSSPWQAGTTHAVLNSIAEVEQIYGVKYVGWSEDISKVRVIKEEIPMPSEAEVRSAFQTYNVTGEAPDGAPGVPSAKQVADYTAEGWDKMLTDLLNYVADREKTEVAGFEKQLKDLQAAGTPIQDIVPPVKPLPNLDPMPLPVPAPDPTEANKENIFVRLFKALFG
jgi:hypothetical protein